MAKIIPELSQERLASIPSNAEKRLYILLRDQLSNDYTVFFEVAWLLKRQDDQARDGETDFIICHPKNGFICVEVKGGGIEYDGVKDEWTSIDGKGEPHEINNPIKQALRAKYSVRNKLKENPSWINRNLGRVCSGHAVFFPDIANLRGFARLDIDNSLVGTAENLSSIDGWVRGCFDFWQRDGSFQELGNSGIAIMESIFAKTFSVKRSMKLLLKDTEEKRIRLTDEQYTILSMLRAQRRAAISGGAGTGKTLIALEKAKRLANEGFRTLLTCYNRPLANSLAVECGGIDNLVVMDFHQLCLDFANRAKKLSGRDLLLEAIATYPNADKYQVHFPMAFAYALDILEDRFDAIVCDEGQDFGEEYWLPLEMSLASLETSPFYIFYDDNQNIYSISGSFPISEPPYFLTINCRNTESIHSEMLPYYSGEEQYIARLEGEAPKHLQSKSLQSQAESISRTVTKLIAEDGISPSSIVVLIVEAKYKSNYFKSMENLTLPKPARFSFDSKTDAGEILVTTVNRFKGLESDIIFLWRTDGLSVSDAKELMYVGISRAKSLLYYVESDFT